MSVHLIRRTLATLSLRQSLPERLAAVYCALELVENAIQELAFLDPLDPPPRWAAAHEQAARVRSALTDAPSIRWPLTMPPPTVMFAANDITTVTDLLIELVEVLVVLLLEAAEEAERPDDQASCLTAALRGNDLNATLHQSRNVRPPSS